MHCILLCKVRNVYQIKVAKGIVYKKIKIIYLTICDSKALWLSGFCRTHTMIKTQFQKCVWINDDRISIFECITLSNNISILTS